MQEIAPALFLLSLLLRIVVVVILAALLAVIPPLLFQGVWTDWIHRAFVFLVVSCPCALVISIPLTFFGGIGAASRHGVLVKGSNYLEVSDATGASSATISRVNRCLNYGNGYRLALDNLKKAGVLDDESDLEA